MLDVIGELGTVFETFPTRSATRLGREGTDLD